MFGSKYKSRFVAKKFSKKKGVDYDKAIAPIAWYNFIHTIFALSTCFIWPRPEWSVDRLIWILLIIMLDKFKTLN